MYTSEWKGSAEAANGVATFTIDGNTFILRCKCFADYQIVINMIELAFAHGKSVAAQEMRSKIERAMDKAAMGRYSITRELCVARRASEPMPSYAGGKNKGD